MTQEARSKLEEYANDPNMIQRVILENVESVLNGTPLDEATNPFTMLIEAAATTAANSIIESKAVMRKKYPSLALQSDELYAHFYDDQLAEMMSVPAETELTFFINVIDLKMHGYRPDNANYVETTLPYDTEINILGIPLTLLNNVVIKLYDNGNIFVEQQPSNIDIAYENIGVITAEIYTDKANTSWIRFTLPIKQVKKSSYNMAIIASNGFRTIIDIKDRYFFSHVTYANANTNNNYVAIPKSHSYEYIDPIEPTMFINVYDKQLLFRLPDAFLLSGQISGSLNIDVYETRGEIYVPINKYTVEDFSYVLGATGQTRSSATMKNIAMLVISESILEGGRNGKTTGELRDSVIYNTTGDIDLPITEKQLEQASLNKGYELIKVEDVITNRLYIACKSLPKVESSMVLAKQDVFFNTTELILSNIDRYKTVNMSGENFVIKSNTVFQNFNGVIKIADNETLEYIDNLSVLDKVKYLKENKFYYTPYYYLVTKDENYSNSRVYDLDNPKISNLVIMGKNVGFSERVNIDKYYVNKTPEGYRLMFTHISNEEFKRIPIENIFIQVKLTLSNGTTPATFYAKYDEVNEWWYVDFETNMLLDNNDNLDLQNGDSKLFTKSFSLLSDVVIYTYTTDLSFKDNTYYLQHEIDQDENRRYCVFTKEKLTISFGNRLDYIYNKLYNTYTERKYKRQTTNYPMVYEEDVYEVNDETGSIYKVVEEGGRTFLRTKLLHKKGEPVLDINGDPVYKYKKGDTILDENGNPIIDQISGIVRYIDILMLEYEFMAATSFIYKNYIKMSVDTLNKFILGDMVSLNEKLLENTSILYRSYKSCRNVIVNINNKNYSMPYLVTPTVTLYMDANSGTTNDNYNNLIDKVGSIINRHFDNSIIRLEDIRNDIKTEIGESCEAVKIEGIDVNNSEVIEISERTSRLVLNKELFNDKNNELIVKYSLKLNILYV